MYLDIDSYNWSVDNEGVAQFEADQEINLVDLKEKTVNRVAFFGPSHRIDDAFWVSDSIFVLLETGSDNRPGIMTRSEEHTFELQSRPHLVCRLLLEKKNDGSHD